MEWLKQFARLFGWRNRQYECLTETNVGGLKVRVWLSCKTLADAVWFDHGRFARRIEQTIALHNNRQAMIGGIMSIPNVTILHLTNQPL